MGQKLCPAFTFTKQASHALVTSLRATFRLITDLLTENSYQFVLTSRFKNDAIERHFSKYRQMSGRNFFLNLLEVNTSKFLPTSAL